MAIAVLGLAALTVVAMLFVRREERVRGEEANAGERGPRADLISIYVNDRPLAAGLILRDGLRRAPYARVSDLQAAVDGPSARQAEHGEEATEQHTSRFQVRGRQFISTDLGGCPGCAVEVVRQVVVSERVRRVDGEAYVPLADLVPAFEGRLAVEDSSRVYRIFAGICRWCILAARS